MKTWSHVLTTLLLVWFTAPTAGAADDGKLHSPDDLHGKRIAVAVGSAQEVWLAKNFPDATLLHYETIPDLAMAVATGKADATLKDQGTLQHLLAANPDMTTLGDSVFASPLASGFRKGEAETRLQFNRYLAKIRSNGLYDAMVDRWMKHDDGTMPKIAFTGKNGTLTVGVALIGLPLANIKDNEPCGFEFELIYRFAAEIGKKPKIELMEIGSMIPAVASGKVDMITALYDTEERRKRIDFSDPIYHLGNQFVVLKKNLAGYVAAPTDGLLHTPADLHGKRIAVLVGSAYEAYATKTYPDSDVQQFQSASDVLTAVRLGKSDASINDTDSLRELQNIDPSIGTVGDSLFTFKTGAGFRKNEGPLRESFNHFLGDLRQRGTFDTVIQPWMLSQRKTMPELPVSQTHGELRIGTANVGLPWATYRDNQLVGADIELMSRFAASMGKKPVFEVMDFGALIPALTSGKVDMIASDIFITEERMKAIDFSDPYYEAENKIYALKKNIAGTPESAALAGNKEESKPTFLSRLKDSFVANIITEKRYLMIWDGLKVTVLISVMATLFGTALGGLVCLMRMSSTPWLHTPAKIYISILRGTPVLVLLMLIFYVVFGSVNISPILVAVIAFGMNFAAYFAEIFRSGMMSIDTGQREAGIAMGLTNVQTFLHVLLPQTVVRILPVYKGEFISLVKMTSVVGYIAVHDLTKAGDIIRSRTFDAFFPLIMVAALYFLVAALFIQVLEYLERRTDPIVRRRRGATR